MVQDREHKFVLNLLWSLNSLFTLKLAKAVRLASEIRSLKNA